MSHFLLAPAAKSDIFEIWDYYASEVGDVELADRMRGEIFDGIRAAAQQPKIGHLRRDLANASASCTISSAFALTVSTVGRPLAFKRFRWTLVWRWKSVNERMSRTEIITLN
jgi:plasmid stabilization system protein ParE